MSEVAEPSRPVEMADGRPAGHRAVPLLAEHQLDHYPEFGDFLRTTFDLAADPFAAPPVVRVDQRHYELIFIGRSGRPFPTGLHIAALVPGLEPLDDDQADQDLWAILLWLVAGVNGEWSAAALSETGRIYRVGKA